MDEVKKIEVRERLQNILLRMKDITERYEKLTGDND